MADEIKITITAVDGASKVFDAVVDAAEEFKPAIDDAAGSARKFTPAAEEAVDAAGDLRPALDGATSSARKFAPAADEAVDAIKPLDKELDEAGKAAKEAGDSIQKSARSLGDYKDAAKDTVAGLALMGTAFTMYAGQAREHEITVMALRRVYGEAADSYVAFANQIQSTTIFSNDEALEAARIMGTLRENYDLTDQQIQQLIATSADLAAMHGFTLTDAAMRVQSAIRGEAESAEMLGLTMNQAAIDTNNLTLTMNQGEAAQFRYNALMDQAASSTGFAAEAAETTAGKTQQLANRFQDAMLAVVGFTGPVGEAASALGSFGIEAGIAVGGIAQLAKGLHGLKAAGAFASLAALGPALLVGGGVVAALGLATYGALELYDALTEVEAVSHSSQMAVDMLADSYTNLGESAANAATLTAAESLHTSITAGLDEATASLEAFQNLWNEYGDEFLNWQAGGNVSPMLESTMLQMQEYINEFGNSAEEAGYKIANMQADLAGIISSGNVAAIRDASAAWNEFQNSSQQASDWATLYSEIDRINHELLYYGGYADDAAEANAQLASSATTAASSISKQTDAQVAANAEFRQWLELHGLAQQYDQERSNAPTIGSAAQVQWLANYSQVMDLAALSAAGFDGAVNAVIKTQPNFITSMGEGERAVVTFTQTLSDGKPEIEAMEEAYRELFMSVAEGAANMNASSVLGGGFSAIVGGAQGMGRIAQQTAEWAGSLAHASGEFTELDKLVLKGQISMTTYNRALDANHRIQQANNDVQEDVLRIQAKQLPIMAQMAEEQAAYVDSIADMPAAQQTAILGFLDTAKASDAMALAQLAAASSTDAMQASTSAMITQMALADPVLKAMLIDMGLISEGADGTISVNYGDAESANDILSALNTTLTDLHAWLQQNFTVTVTTDDQATGPLSLIEQALANLDGKSATVYVRSAGGVGANIGFLSETARDGGVVGYANGGMVMAQLAEVGPELVRLASGGEAYAPANGLYMVERGSNVMPAEASKAELARRRQSGGDTYIYSGQVTQRITYEESSFARRRAAIAGNRR